MKSVICGHGFMPITYCTRLPKVRGRPRVPPANSADRRVVMGEQQDLKDLGKIKAPSIQVFHLEEGSAALWLMSRGGLEEKNTMFTQRAKHLALSSGPERSCFSCLETGKTCPVSAASSSSRAALYCYGPARCTVNHGRPSDTTGSCNNDWPSDTTGTCNNDWPKYNTEMLICVNDRKAQCNALQPVINPQI